MREEEKVRVIKSRLRRQFAWKAENCYWISAYLSLFILCEHIHLIARNQARRQASHGRRQREDGCNVLHVLDDDYDVESGDISTILSRLSKGILQRLRKKQARDYDNIQLSER